MQFRAVPSLRGELKRTEIRMNTRYQLTTKEFVLQKNGSTYRIALENVLGMMECTPEDSHSHIFSDGSSFGVPYKIIATLLHIVLPHGVVEQNGVSFYIRLSPAFAKQMTVILGTLAMPH